MLKTFAKKISLKKELEGEIAEGPEIIVLLAEWFIIMLLEGSRLIAISVRESTVRPGFALQVSIPLTGSDSLVDQQFHR